MYFPKSGLLRTGWLTDEKNPPPFASQKAVDQSAVALYQSIAKPVKKKNARLIIGMISFPHG